MENDFKTMPLNLLRSCVESAVREMNDEFCDREYQIEEWVAGEGDGRWKIMNVYGSLMDSPEWKVLMISRFDKLVDSLQRRERAELKALLNLRLVAA